MATITIDNADVLEHLADKPAHGASLSMLNVTFIKSLPEANLTLPILFKTMVVKLGAMFSSATGAVLEYNPANPGGEGDRQDDQQTSERFQVPLMTIS